MKYGILKYKLDSIIFLKSMIFLKEMKLKIKPLLLGIELTAFLKA